MGLNFLIFFCGHAGPSGVWPLGPTCPLPRVSHRWCRIHGAQLGAPEAMTQQPIAIGVWPVVVVFFLSRCGGALVDGFDFPDIFSVGILAPVVFGPWAQHAHCQGTATSGAGFFGPLGPLPRVSHRWCRLHWALWPHPRDNHKWCRFHGCQLVPPKP